MCDHAWCGVVSTLAGVQMHFRELTFSVNGSLNLTELRLERPRVLFNKNTSKYVMWYYADDFYQSSRLAGEVWLLFTIIDVCVLLRCSRPPWVQHDRCWLSWPGISTSDYPDGPFGFVKLLKPDNNATVDFQLFQDDDGTAFMARTYYINQTYGARGRVVVCCFLSCL